jgi:hypothetical protein
MWVLLTLILLKPENSFAPAVTIIKELETPGQQKQKKITTKHIYFNIKQPFTTTSVKKLFSKYNKRA